MQACVRAQSSRDGLGARCGVENPALRLRPTANSREMEAVAVRRLESCSCAAAQQTVTRTRRVGQELQLRDCSADSCTHAARGFVGLLDLLGTN
eukprot:641783-Rhodomonas_salina.1